MNSCGWTACGETGTDWNRATEMKNGDTEVTTNDPVKAAGYLGKGNSI